MRSGTRDRDDTALWDVACPERPSRIAGVRMAGFRGRGVTPIDLRVIPHPTVMLALEFGSGSPFVDDAAGKRHWGSFVAGLGTGSRGAVRVRGEKFEGVQVRLSPVVARAALGVPRPSSTALWWPSTTCGAARRPASVNSWTAPPRGRTASR